MPEGFEEKLAVFQRHVIETSKKNNYHMSQIGNADEMPVQFGTPSNYTVDNVQAQTLVIKTLGYDKIHVTVMLAVFSCTNDSKGKLKRSAP
jgi:hypothetical protein